MANPLHDDYLFLGPLLAQRLREVVPGMPVDLCERADQVLAADRRTRVLMVLWAGERFGGRADFSGAQAVAHRWLVCLGLNNAGVQADARNAVAGPLLSAVHLGLAGWKPPGCARPMGRVTAPMAPTFTDTKAVYPLAFEIPLSL